VFFIKLFRKSSDFSVKGVNKPLHHINGRGETRVNKKTIAAGITTAGIIGTGYAIYKAFFPPSIKKYAAITAASLTLITFTNPGIIGRTHQAIIDYFNQKETITRLTTENQQYQRNQETIQEQLTGVMRENIRLEKTVNRQNNLLRTQTETLEEQTEKITELSIYEGRCPGVGEKIYHTLTNW